MKKRREGKNEAHQQLVQFDGIYNTEQLTARKGIE
jgi:hypothetical protein